MTEPKSLEALATEYARDIGQAIGDGAHYVEIPWLKERLERFLAAYLAARPATDLERRLREDAEQFVSPLHGAQTRKALLLEAADALAHASLILSYNVDLTRSVETLELTEERLEKRIADLERELAEMRDMLKAVNGKHVKQTERAEAAEARLAAVTRLPEEWRKAAWEHRADGYAQAAGDYEEFADKLDVALAAPAQEVKP